MPERRQRKKRAPYTTISLASMAPLRLLRAKVPKTLLEDEPAIAKFLAPLNRSGLSGDYREKAKATAKAWEKRRKKLDVEGA